MSRMSGLTSTVPRVASAENLSLDRARVQPTLHMATETTKHSVLQNTFLFKRYKPLIFKFSRKQQAPCNNSSSGVQKSSTEAAYPRSPSAWLRGLSQHVSLSGRGRIACVRTNATLPGPAPLYPNAEFDFRPQLSWAQVLRCVALGAAAGGLYLLYRWRSVMTLAHPLSGPFSLLDIVTVALLALGGVVGGVTRAWEAQYRARQVSAAEAADEDSLFARVRGVLLHFKASRGGARLRAPFPPAPLQDEAQGGSGEQAGAGAGWAAQLWHGFGANTYSWERAVLHPLSRALGPASLVAAHDCPGFGLSERPRDLACYGLRANAQLGRDLLEDLLRQTDPSPPAGAVATDGSTWRRLYMGHSMGGRSAALAATMGAAGGEEAPPAPAAVVLVAPAIVPEGPRRAPPAGLLAALLPAARLLRAVITRVASVVADALWAIAYPLLLTGLRVAVRQRGFWERGLAGAAARASTVDSALVDGYRRPQLVRAWDEGLLRFVEAVLRPPPLPAPAAAASRGLVQQLADSGVPVLIVHGAQDAIVPASNSKRLAQLLPRAELVILDNCGHVPMEECPEAFLAAVTAFVDKL